MFLRFLPSGAEESTMFTLMRRTLHQTGALVAGDVMPGWATTHRTRSYFLPLAASYAVILAGFGALSIVDLTTGLDASDLVRDPAAVSRSAPWYGVVSNIGVLLWCAAAAICLFSALLLRNDPERRRSALFLLSAGLITSVLLVDDLFMVHEWLLPKLGISEYVMYGLYALLGFAFVGCFARDLGSAQLPVLLLACTCFAISIGIDVFIDTAEEASSEGLSILAEDGIKFLGIVAWLYYFGLVAYGIVVTQLPPRRSPAI
jgi:hypothetical protein